jgi:hypothetical protein
MPLPRRHWWIRLLPAFVVCTLLLAAWAAAGGPEGQHSLAKVTVSGKEAGAVTIDDGTKKERFVLIEEDNRTTIKVGTNQDVAKFSEQILAEHRELTVKFTEKAKELIDKNDFAALKKAEQEFKAASDEMLKYISYVTAEGTVRMVGDELRMEGKVRAFAFKGADKELGKGKALVEGEATQVKYDAGQGAKMALAIQNGAKAIVVTGKAADEHLNTKGTIRVLGVLRAGGKTGHPVLEAEKIEVPKK